VLRPAVWTSTHAPNLRPKVTVGPLCSVSMICSSSSHIRSNVKTLILESWVYLRDDDDRWITNQSDRVGNEDVQSDGVFPAKCGLWSRRTARVCLVLMSWNGGGYFCPCRRDEVKWGRKSNSTWAPILGPTPPFHYIMFAVSISEIKVLCKLYFSFVFGNSFWVF